MVEKCSKCDVDITIPKECIKCSDCSVLCCPNCTGKVTRNKKWKCETCAMECLSNSSKLSEAGTASTSAVLDAIAAFRKENNARWDDNAVKLDLVQAEMQNFKFQIAEVKGELTEVKEECNKTKDRVDSLTEVNKQLRIDLENVKQQVLDLEQHTRKCNILISGVPLTPKEDLMGLLGVIANVLQLQYFPSSISAVHRLQGRREDARPPSIIVNFVSRQLKEEWLAARRRKGKLSAKELHGTFQDTPVYLNEHLTPQTRAIFNGARDLMKQKKLSSVWTTDCRVMAKVSPDHRPFRVWDLQHVHKLRNATPSPTAPVHHVAHS